MLIHQGKVLKDATTLEENKVADNSFIVIMLSKLLMDAIFRNLMFICLLLLGTRVLPKTSVVSLRMINVGESSQAREERPQMPREEEFRDIQVVWEQLLSRESAPLVTVVEDEDDDVETDEDDPVELPQSNEDDEDEEEEIPLNSITARMYDEVYDRNVELQDTVEELEEIVAEQQTSMAQKDDEILDREERLNNVEEKLIHTEGVNEQLIEEIAELKNKLKEESTKRKRAEDAYEEAFQRAEIVVRDA